MPAMDEGDFKRIIEGALTGVRDEIAETRRRAEALAKDARQHTDSVAEETRRHFDVVAEQLTGDMKLLAEGFADLSARVDRKADAEEMRQEFAEVRSMIRFSHVDLDRRLRTLEDVAALQVRVDRIEGSLPQ